MTTLRPDHLNLHEPVPGFYLFAGRREAVTIVEIDHDGVTIVDQDGDIRRERHDRVRLAAEWPHLPRRTSA